MAWDFETEPEFEEDLAWMRAFIDREIIPLEPLFDSCPPRSGRSSNATSRTRSKNAASGGPSSTRTSAGRGSGSCTWR